MFDTPKHQALRRNLVEQLKAKGIKDATVLQAIGKIPRHLFMESAMLKFAYEDTAFKIGEGQTISQPFTVAFQTTLLQVKPGDKVLEIGTGSGYQAAVLDAIGAKVYSIERHKKLHVQASVLLKELNCKVKCFYGDGYNGLQAFAPFDRIIITAAAPFIPDALPEQLQAGGILVVPLGEGATQVMKQIKKLPGNTYSTKDFGNFSFVPMIHSTDWVVRKNDKN
jgi:protein-L-isoaspartate(D-aspartate) O-methyltransferase